MKPMLRLLPFAAAGAFTLWCMQPAPLRADSDLFARMQALNPDLHSFTATMRAHVALTTFPFLATDIVATYYHKDPDLDKLDVQSGLPMLAQGFSKLYAHIEPPSQWNRVYVVTPGKDDGSTATFTLVPRTQGNVTKLIASVDDASATIKSLRWEFANGGWASVDQQYGHVNGEVVVTAQNGHVEEPGYTGTIAATLTDYKMNPDLPDSMFKQ
jgi:hypothetical protein